MRLGDKNLKECIAKLEKSLHSNKLFDTLSINVNIHTDDISAILEKYLLQGYNVRTGKTTTICKRFL